MHAWIIDYLFQSCLREALPVRTFRARPGQVDGFGLADEIVELHEHESGFAAPELAVDRSEDRRGPPGCILDIVVLVVGGVLVQREKAFAQVRPFDPRFVGRGGVQLATFEALVDVATAPPSCERG